MSTGNYDLQINWPNGRHSSTGAITDEQWGEIARILSPDHSAQSLNMVGSPQPSAVPDALREAVEYLDDNKFNSIGAGSILHRTMRGAIESAPAAVQGDGWIPTWEKMPESGRTVLAHYRNSHGKGRTIRAQYIKAWTVQAEDMADPDIECVEYSEQDDAYYLLEGWYECIDNWDDYSSVAVNEGTITHWMPLPAAPSSQQQEVK